MVIEIEVAEVDKATAQYHNGLDVLQVEDSEELRFMEKV